VTPDPKTEHDDDLRAFSRIAPADRDAFRFATMSLNLPDHEAWFITWDVMAEIKSHMEESESKNYVLLEGPSGNKWAPLRTTDIKKDLPEELKAILISSPSSRMHLVLSDSL